MKAPVAWLSEWVDAGLDATGIAARFTMLGLEVDEVSAVAPGLAGVVAGEVVELARHPGADRLSLCRVRINDGEPLRIVCGASNVKLGGRYPVAVEGATLPSGMRIRRGKIRGEISEGMLCSASELGLEAESAGLLELPVDAPVGADVIALLALDDHVLDINVTPNRADCLSIRGLARELAAALDAALRNPAASNVAPAHSDRLRVTVADPGDCPRFAGRIIRGLNPAAATPVWMRERLRRAGVRPLYPVVDVTNYVMLELGQPLHAYDLGALQGGISVRRGTPGDDFELLDGRRVTPDGETLVIADDSGAIGLAGIMGGRHTAVHAGTTAVFLESAFFAPAVIAGRARRTGLHTDASLRFERGVDPELQAAAIERATALILAIAGGKPGPVDLTASRDTGAPRRAVTLREARLGRILGLRIPASRCEGILSRLGMAVRQGPAGWEVTPPSWRFDIEREEDLVEEIARVHGYDQVPEIAGSGSAALGTATETRLDTTAVRQLLAARGYQEVITYSFVDEKADADFSGGNAAGLALSNPISSELAIMRQSLWPGLMAVAQRNLARQEPRIRIFEAGTCFPVSETGMREESRLAGLLVGPRWPEQWGERSRPADLHDARNDLDTILNAGTAPGDVIFEAGGHPALHPGKCARIRRGDQPLGWLGELHPALARRLGLRDAPVLFELNLGEAAGRAVPGFQPVSRFPRVRRDLALVVADTVAVGDLVAVARSTAPEVIREVIVFDIYAGANIGTGQKSVAIGLILQDASRTLTDADVDRHTSAVVGALTERFQASVRE